MHGSHNIIYPLRGLHNLAYDNVNSVMVNGYDIIRSMFATLRIYRECSIWKGLLSCIHPVKEDLQTTSIFHHKQYPPFLFIPRIPIIIPIVTQINIPIVFIEHIVRKVIILFPRVVVHGDSWVDDTCIILTTFTVQNPYDPNDFHWLQLI